jgi:hypothetical protein
MRMMGLAVVLTLSLTLAPLAAEAQPAGNVVTIGILAIEAFPPIDSFRQRLRDLGYIEEPAWIGLEGYECTHRPGDLVRTTA